jgi:hypothetical protein
VSFHSLLIHTVTVFNPVDPPAIDARYGDELLQHDAGTTHPGRVDERSSTELDIDRDTRTQHYTVFFEPDVTISALSYMTWDTHELRIDGEPLMKYDGRGPHHWEVECSEALG